VGKREEGRGKREEGMGKREEGMGNGECIPRVKRVAEGDARAGVGTVEKRVKSKKFRKE
jgi:hypothetical protein